MTNSTKKRYVSGELIEDSCVIYKKEGIFLQKGLMLENGSEIWFPGCDFEDFHEGLAVIEDGKKCGYINREGDVVIRMKYTVANEFNEGHAFVSDLRHTYIIDTEGNQKVISDEQLISAGFSEGFSKVALIADKAESKVEGIVNTQGKFTMPFTYSTNIDSPFSLMNEEDLFREGLVRVKHRNKFGFVDGSGNIEIPFRFDRVSRFEDGYAAVVTDNWASFINRKGEVILDPVFENAGFYFSGLFFVKKMDSGVP